MAIEGLGSYITRSGFAWKVKSIGGPSVTHDDIEVTDLSSTGFKEYICSTLADIGEITAEVYYDGTEPTTGSTATTRITDRNGSYIQGSFYIKSFDIGDRTEGEPVMMTITMRSTGGASALTFG